MSLESELRPIIDELKKLAVDGTTISLYVGREEHRERDGIPGTHYEDFGFRNVSKDDEQDFDALILQMRNLVHTGAKRRGLLKAMLEKLTDVNEVVGDPSEIEAGLMKLFEKEAEPSHPNKPR